ncbi:DUF3048 domain-containing protein [Kribbella sp. NPDC051137]|uniref:DUF3048 domain-containing protein n=1 Tax=Kribbella sp. NPDC051137 TaxID=3155045 RepID=UPI002F891E23
MNLSSRRGRIVAVVVVLVALVGAVVGIVASRRGAEPGAPAATPTPAPTTEGPVNMAGRAPLTGLPAAGPLDRPAIAVKISNTPDAHPQRGVADADIVFVEPITTGTTRLAAIFQSKLPAEAGPVRSLRLMDAGLIGPTKGILADAMAEQWVLDYIHRVADLDDLGTLTVPAGTYHIDSTRRAPNHVFARPQKLLALSHRKAAPAPYFGYASGLARSTAQLSGRPASAVTIGYGDTSTATWTYQQTSHRWARTEQWAPRVVQATADNVMVLTMNRDTSFPRAKPSMTVIDVFNASGTLKLLTGDKVITGKWSKAGANDPFKFSTTDGKPLLLTPGTTWVECPLTTMPVQLK